MRGGSRMSDESGQQNSLPLISSAADSPVRMSPSRERALASRARARASGTSSGASSANSGPASSSSRTSRVANVDGCPTCATTCSLSATVRLPPTCLPSTLGRPNVEHECSWLPITKVAARAGQRIPKLRLYPSPTVKGDHNHPGAGYRSGYGLATVVAPDGPLNPRFVEWLMGFPDGWTDCEPLAMPLFPSVPKQSDD
jgi:hypothetical protein